MGYRSFTKNWTKFIAGHRQHTFSVQAAAIKRWQDSLFSLGCGLYGQGMRLDHVSGGAWTGYEVPGNEAVKATRQEQIRVLI